MMDYYTCNVAPVTNLQNVYVDMKYFNERLAHSYTFCSGFRKTYVKVWIYDISHCMIADIPCTSADDCGVLPSHTPVGDRDEYFCRGDNWHCIDSLCRCFEHGRP